jgi:hypothetical protein
VRELVLVLPDRPTREADPQTAARGGSVATAETGLTQRRFAAPRALRGGWRAMLARGVGRPDLALVDVASVVDAALQLRRAADAVAVVTDVWMATPLHLLAGLKTLHLPANGLLRLAPEEAAEMASEFAKVFGGDGLELQPAGAAGFVLRGFAAPGVLTVEPTRLAQSLETNLPSGAGSAELRALASELEMWLHELPLNRRREARGEPRISSLWLWGGGESPRDPLRAGAAADAEPMADEAATRWSLLVADDVWVEALAQLAGVPFAPLGDSLPPLLASDDASVCVVATRGAVDHVGLETAFIAPAMAALEAGRMERWVLAANDRWIAATRGDRWRVWRPRRSWLAAVADGSP